jgi:hypothetical protein
LYNVATSASQGKRLQNCTVVRPAIETKVLALVALAAAVALLAVETVAVDVLADNAVVVVTAALVAAIALLGVVTATAALLVGVWPVAEPQAAKNRLAPPESSRRMAARRDGTGNDGITGSFILNGVAPPWGVSPGEGPAMGALASESGSLAGSIQVHCATGVRLD